MNQQEALPFDPSPEALNEEACRAVGHRGGDGLGQKRERHPRTMTFNLQSHLDAPDAGKTAEWADAAERALLSDRQLSTVHFLLSAEPAGSGADIIQIWDGDEFWEGEGENRPTALEAAIRSMLRELRLREDLELVSAAHLR